MPCTNGEVTVEGSVESVVNYRHVDLKRKVVVTLKKTEKGF